MAKKKHHSVEDAISGKALPVRLDNGQTVWLQVRRGDGKDERLRELMVVDRPWRSDASKVASSLVYRCGVLEDEGIVEAASGLMDFIWWLEETHGPHLKPELFLTRLQGEEAGTKLLKEAKVEGVTSDVLRPEVYRALKLVEGELRRRRSGFDAASREERLALVGHTCRRVYKALNALKSVVEFAEYGTPKGKLNPAIKKAAVDVKAAFSRHVDGMTNAEVAHLLGEPGRSDRSKVHNDYPATRQRIKRGIGLLEKAYGIDGWSKLSGKLRWIPRRPTM